MTQNHFNKLRPDELERLAMLAEEASEVIQIINKIIRHGYESYHPKNPGLTNRILLSKEVAEFYAITTLMEVDFDPTACEDTDEIIRRKLKYMHHQL